MSENPTSTHRRTRRPVPEVAPDQTQLLLVVEHPVPWRLDETTREIGRKGVARARAVLASSRPPRLDQAA